MIAGSLAEGDLADLGDNDCGNQDFGMLCDNGGEVLGVRSVVEAFKPCGGVEDVCFHRCLSDFSADGCLEFTITFAVEFERSVAFEKSDEFCSCHDGEDLDVVLFDFELESLARSEGKLLTDFLRDYDLVFGGK